jgi:HEAT repeat protein
VNHPLRTLIQHATQGEDAGVRREAIIELGYQEDESVYPVLIEQLEDINSSVQHAAVISLGRYGDQRAIEELIKPKILHSPEVDIRWAAVAAITRLGDIRIIDQLLKATDDPEWIVRNQAVTGLKEKIQQIIEEGDNRHVRILIRLLSLENEEIVELAIEGLRKLGEDKVDLILKSLQSASIPMRENAARVLGVLKSSQAVDPLIHRLQDSEWTVRRSAIESLGQIGDRRAIEPLVQRLSDNVTRVRRQARLALVQFGKLSTSPLLDALAHEYNKFALRAILLTLGDIQDERSIPALKECLRSSYFVVRMAATRALVQFGNGVIESLLLGLSFNRSDIKTLLRDASNRENPTLQLRAIRALGGLEDHRAVGLLKNLVEEGTSEVQDAAIEALTQIGCSAWGRCSILCILSQLGDHSIVPHIVESLNDDSNNVRLESVRALARIDGDDVIEPLTQVAMKETDSYIRFETVRLLRNIGVGKAPVLKMALQALKDPSRDVRSQAARLLGNFQDVQSIQPLLRKTADKHWSVRESAEIALLNFGKTAVPQLIKALESRSWTTRFRAARILGEVGDKRAIEPLVKLLNRKGERRAVSEVIQESLKKLRTRLAA